MKFLREVEKFGAVLEPGDGVDRSAEGLLAACRAHGLCVTSGLENAAEFTRLTDFLLLRLKDASDTGRTNHPEESALQTVTTGEFPLSWHAEFGTTPLRPDILGLYCVDPGTAGDTLLCDGVSLWRNVSDRVRSYFQENRLYFRCRMISRWDDFYGAPLASGAISPGERVARLRRLEPSVELLAEDEKGIWYAWRPSAVTRVGTDQQEALACNIFRGVYEDTGYRPRVGDGELIPDEILADVKKTADEVAVAVRWSAGQMALVDNHRCLHARTKPEGSRLVYFTCGYTGAMLGQVYAALSVPA